MTHVADDETIGRFARRIKGLLERALAGSLNLDKLWDIVQGYLDGKLVNVEGVLRGTHLIVEVEKPGAVFILNTVEPPGYGMWKDVKRDVEEGKSLGIATIRFADGEMFIDGRRINEYLYVAYKYGDEEIDGRSITDQPLDKYLFPRALLDLLTAEQDNPEVMAFLQKREERHPFHWSIIYSNSCGIYSGRRLVKFEERFYWHDFSYDHDDDDNERFPRLILPPLATPEESKAV